MIWLRFNQLVKKIDDSVRSLHVLIELLGKLRPIPDAEADSATVDEIEEVL